MLKQRVLTAILIAPLSLLAIIYLPLLPFAVFTGAIVAFAAWEWGNLAALSPVQRKLYVLLFIACLVLGYSLPTAAQTGLIWLALPLWVLNFVLVCRYPESVKFWRMRGTRALMGLLMLVSAWIALITLRQQLHGWQLILILLFLVWSADIGAYFSGKAWGNKKLAPQVSPGKTWEGFYGGLLAALVSACVFAVVFGVVSFSQWNALATIGLIALACSAISVVGDLTESMFKRHRGVKDSGAILPGHGGVLDRIDSLLAALPFYAILMVYV